MRVTVAWDGVFFLNVYIKASSGNYPYEQMKSAKG